MFFWLCGNNANIDSYQASGSRVVKRFEETGHILICDQSTQCSSIPVIILRSRDVAYYSSKQALETYLFAIDLSLGVWQESLVLFWFLYTFFLGISLQKNSYIHTYTVCIFRLEQNIYQI